MTNKTVVLGISINVLTMKDAVNTVLSFFEQNDEMKTIFTVGPEIAMHARKNEEYTKILNQGDLVTPDGVGVVWASKFNKIKIKERVDGCNLCMHLFSKMNDNRKTAYFLGGAPGVAEKAKKNIEKKYPGLKIVGVNDGYFNEEKEKLIIDEINQLQPDLLLVGMGAPKQEQWISTYKPILKCRAAIGVGGSLDVFAGNVKRAPKFWVKLNLEWLYRLITEPRKRFKRQLKLPWFVIIVITQKIMRQ